MYREDVDGSILIAERAAAVKFEDFTEKEVAVTKLAILDTLGVIIAASTLGNRCKDLVEYAEETGGRPEATILGRGTKVPAVNAALANGAMAHSLDFDDHVVMGGHQSAGSVEAALAALEYVGGGTGKDFITAVAVGADALIRLHYAVPKCTAAGWVGTAVSSVYGGTLAAAKAMGLDAKGINDAIGWGLWQTSFPGQCLDEAGSDARENYCGFAQSYGVFAAILAKKGMHSTVNNFEGQDGLFNKYYRPFTDVDPQHVHVKIGDAWQGQFGAFKPWSCCGQTHSYLQATREIVAENGITPDMIDHIFVKVGNLGKRLIENPASRYTPAKANDARFSIPYTMAVMIKNGNVRLEDFLPEKLHEYYDLAAKVKWEFSQEIADSLTVELGLETAYVQFTLTDGRVIEKTVNIPYGHTANPMTTEDVCEKFRDCASHSYNKLSSETIEKIIDTCLNLEKLDDINVLINLLNG